jgi:hypothetical protein
LVSRFSKAWITPERMYELEPSRASFSFSRQDALCSFAEAHGMKMEGGRGECGCCLQLGRTAQEARSLIDAVGFQSHFASVPNFGSIAASMQMFAAIGLHVFVTEFDYRIPSSDRRTARNHTDLQIQASVYKNLLATCLAASSCAEFLTWGFTDVGSTGSLPIVLPRRGGTGCWHCSVAAGGYYFLFRLYHGSVISRPSSNVTEGR